MRKSQLKRALLVSLLLHAGVLLWLWLLPPWVPPAHPKPVTLTWVEVEVPPPQQTVVPPPPVVPPVKPPSPPRPHAPAPPTAPPEPSEPTAKAPPPPVPEDKPKRAPDVPLTLVPRSDFAVPGGPSEGPRGHTLHPTDPQFQPEAMRKEEEKRVHGRVDGWARDALAEARAEGGLPDPYFWRVRDVAVAALGKHAKEAGVIATGRQVFENTGRRYTGAAEEFAKTGNPNLGPLGDAPTQSETLKQRFGDDPETNSVRALVQATETQEQLSHGKPLLALKMQQRQFKDGSAPMVQLVSGSGDDKFDAFVLDEWRKALAQAGPPPEASFHGDEVRTIWSVEGWLGLPKKMEQAFSYLPVPGVMGIGADKVLPQLTDEGYHYEFHARILRVYQ
jgi:hypothetical protein